MKSKIHASSLLSIIYFFLVLQISAQQELTLDKLVGTYVTGHGHGGSSITLKSDGRYSIESGNHDHSGSKATGTYVFSGGLLRFIMERYVVREMGVDREINLLDPKQIKEQFGK